MKRTLLLLASAAAVMLIMLGLTSSLYSQQGTSVKIGVVDLQEVSTRFEKWKRLAKKLEEETEASNKKLGEREKSIGTSQEKLKNFERGSDTAREIEVQIFKAQGDLKSFFEREQERLKSMAEKLGGDLLDNIEEVIKKYGRQNGFTLIIKKEEVPLQGRDWQELRSYVSRKAVMYYAANIDLTEKIVEILNRDFK